MNVVVIAVTVTSWHGKDRVEFLERVLVGDIAGLDKVSLQWTVVALMRPQLTVLCESGQSHSLRHYQRKWRHCR